jgi:hypothetical protein
MKKHLFIFLLLLNTILSFSQNFDSFKNWDKIIITDAYGGWTSFNNTYIISKKADKLFLTNASDSIIKEIDQTIINNLFNSLKNIEGADIDPIRIYGKDSVWFINNAEQLWMPYLKKRKELNQVDSLAISTIKKYQKIKSLIRNFPQGTWTDDYPFCSLSFIKGKDTASIQSFAQGSYMLPWHIDGQTIYNSGISTAIASILPDKKKSNKYRLSGESFYDDLIEDIYNNFIDNERDIILTKKKYPSKFKKLNKYFEIETAFLGSMESIEWEGFFPLDLLEMTLHEKSSPPNIKFYVVFGRPFGILRSINPLINERKELINVLQKNEVYNYTVNCKDCIGKIHYVNKRSMSKEAKSNFLEYLGERKNNIQITKKMLQGAIFYELTEKRGEEESFSRWIFLKDGKMILWELEGAFLMNYPPEIIQEKGYVCRLMN